MDFSKQNEVSEKKYQVRQVIGKRGLWIPWSFSRG